MNNVKLYAKISNIEQRKAQKPKEQKEQKEQNIENKNNPFLLIDETSTESGYQGYVYENVLNGEIIVVHNGSESIALGANKSEIKKDWLETDFVAFALKVIPDQFYDSNIFLNKVKRKYADKKIVQVGQSLGGFLAELNGCLEDNKDIETYTYNSLGAANLMPKLVKAGYKLSNDYSNIKNYTYKNEQIAKLKPHIGDLYVANYKETQGLKYHSIEAHQENDLNYVLQGRVEKHKKIKHALKKIVSPFKQKKVSSSTNEQGHWITTKQGNKVFIEDSLIDDLKWYYPELENNPDDEEDIEELNSNNKEVDKNPPLSIMQKGLQMDETSENDYWYLPNVPLTKSGVFPYYGQQISPNLEPDKLYMVYRPAEEIASEDALKTLELLPVIEDHAMLGTRPGMMPPEEKGIQGITGTNIYCENGVVYGDIKIFTEYLKNVINSGKHEISMGYFCDYDYRSGYYNGQRYDVIQRNLRGNHIAIVDKGRMGEEVCIPQMYNQGVYDGVNTRILVADETVVYSSEVQSSYRSLEEQWQAYLRGE